MPINNNPVRTAAAQSPVVSVTQVNTVIEMLIKGDKRLAKVAVRGEISNFSRHTKTGHLYFTLKDANTQLRAVMFESSASELEFSPQDGDKVVCRGAITVYPAGGVYQIRCYAMEKDGEGEQARALEELRRRLEAEGLFSQRRPLPARPKRIAVVTSPDAAALQDIINIVGRRWPVASLVVVPVLVQGVNAAASIAEGINTAQHSGADVIIVGRGGGSSEDLSAFSSEQVVRAVYASRIPTISAVGHETDRSLCDFTADRYAPTPSAAAELAVPDKNDLKAQLDATLDFAALCTKRALASKERELSSRAEIIRALSPQNRIKSREQSLNALSEGIALRMHTKLERAERSLARNAEVISALNPLGVLARGFSVTYCGGRIVSDSSQLKKGSEVEVKLANGSFSANIIDIKE